MTVENKRVYELAKEYSMSNKDFIEYLEQKLDIKVKSHSSTLMPSQVEKIKQSFEKKKEDQPQKKPKAFIIKKAKTTTDTQALEQEKSEDDVSDKAENKQPEQTNEFKSDNQPNEETKQPQIPQIRSLLEYNNRNSQKRRQEMLQNKQKEAGRSVVKKDSKPNPNYRQKPQNENQLKNESKEKQDKKQAFDKNKNEERKQESSKEKTTQLNKKPIRHHVISQEIYETKSSTNPAFKKKGPKDKKQQYKNKDEE